MGAIRWRVTVHLNSGTEIIVNKLCITEKEALHIAHTLDDESLPCRRVKVETAEGFFLIKQKNISGVFLDQVMVE